MNTDPKALYLNALDKAALAYNKLVINHSDTVKLCDAEFIRNQLSDALMSMNALIRRIRQEPEPRTGDTEDGK